MSSPILRRLCRNLLIAFAILLAGPLSAASLKDLLNPDRLARHVRADATQKAALAGQIQRLRKAIGDYQWERGKQTCEAVLWQNHIPDIRQLRNLRKHARKAVDAILDTLKAGLNPKQVQRVEKLLKKEENILDLPISELPFYHINNTPLFDRFQSTAEAYWVALPGSPSPDDGWSYADLLRTWTVRGFVPAQRPVDAIGQDNTGVTQQPYLQTRVMQRSIEGRIVNSPLLLAATLLVPDLGRSELDLLWDHYPHSEQDRGAMWTRYREQNRLDDAILVRLKMSTSFAEGYLDSDRWIVYLEDSEGTGYEPIHTQQEGLRPIEALEVSVPGREIEVTDVFGNYYPYIPGYKETFYLEAPAEITYTGHEKLLKLFFPGRDFQKRPIVTERTEYLKLIVQSQDEEYQRVELVWKLKSRKPKSPPKDRE